MDALYHLLRDYSLEELLEHCNISDEEVLEALFQQGYSFSVQQGIDYGHIGQSTAKEEE